MEGKDVQVEVYSRYPSVRLYLNNKLIGEQSTSVTQEFKAIFNVPYEVGTIKAVGVKDGKEQQSTTLKTAGNAAIIKLTPDRKIIKANGQDLSYITIQITDKNAVLQPNGENNLSYQVKGPGVIVGAGNANLQDTSPYVATNGKTWKGRATVIIKSRYNKGPIILEASSPGLPKASVIIKAY
jgi:beta-galactosidase